MDKFLVKKNQKETIDNNKLILEDETLLLIIDVQKKLITNIKDNELLIFNIKKLINTCNLLDVRIVITEQMLAIQKLPKVDVALTVHDEIIAIGPDTYADETLATIMAIMKQPPTWCTELPLDAEGAYSKIYNK